MHFPHLTIAVIIFVTVNIQSISGAIDSIRGDGGKDEIASLLKAVKTFPSNATDITTTAPTTTTLSSSTTTENSTSTPSTPAPPPEKLYQVLINPYYAILLKDELGIDDCSVAVHVNFTIALLDRNRDVVDKSAMIDNYEMVEYDSTDHPNACLLLFRPPPVNVQLPKSTTKVPEVAFEPMLQASKDSSPSTNRMAVLRPPTAQKSTVTELDPKAVLIVENGRVQLKLVVYALNDTGEGEQLGSITFIESVYAWKYNFWREKALTNIRGHGLGRSTMMFSYYARHINGTCHDQKNYKTRVIRECPAWVETSLWFVLVCCVCALQFSVLIGALFVWACVDWSEVYKVQRRKRRRHKRKLKQHELEETYNAVAVEQSHDDENERLSDESV